MNQAIIMGFSDNDHAIKELMRFIKLTSRRYTHEDDSYKSGAPNYKRIMAWNSKAFISFHILNLSIGNAVL